MIVRAISLLYKKLIVTLQSKFTEILSQYRYPNIKTGIWPGRLAASFLDHCCPSWGWGGGGLRARHSTGGGGPGGGCGGEKGYVPLDKAVRGRGLSYR